VITEKDLQEAIAECQGQRNPNANTCIKLAAYYTIQKELYGDRELPAYSRAEPPVEQPEEYIDYNSGSEFSQIINGMTARDAWAIMDELMDILQATNPRLYAGVIQKLEEG
jgi:hypothetical protein